MKPTIDGLNEIIEQSDKEKLVAILRREYARLLLLKLESYPRELPFVEKELRKMQSQGSYVGKYSSLLSDPMPIATEASEELINPTVS